MSVTPETRRWDALAAARTKGDVGDGIASVLALLGKPEVISFAGGFPDPETFPRERVATLVQEFLAEGEASAFQYAPTRGLAARSTRSPAGWRRSRAGARTTTSSSSRAARSKHSSSSARRSWTPATPSSSRVRRISARSRRSGGSRRSSSPYRSTSTGSTSTSWRAASRPACARSSSTRSRIIKIPPA